MYVNSLSGLKVVTYRKSKRNIRRARGFDQVLLVRVDGNCCWKAFEGTSRTGRSTLLEPGFSGDDAVEIGSIAKVDC